ncbi:MAG: molybdopterin-dependent oxidoreductase [Candidatus Moduliflexus flocculans]|nr:molybdopterin-dependent oxidoreductase [Candidatus Moduliflexus flocculans]
MQGPSRSSCVLTREEEFYTAFVRQGLVAHFKMGCDEDGNLLAMENTHSIGMAGAYTEYGVNITRAAGYSSSGPYEVPNVKTDSYCVYTNHPVGGPMRGFGMPEMHAGLEQCIDELAHQDRHGCGRVPQAQLREDRRVSW